jgi:nitrogen regulatory protein PII
MAREQGTFRPTFIQDVSLCLPAWWPGNSGCMGPGAAAPGSQGDIREATLMKLVTAIVKPGKLDDVMRAATDAGARGLTATEVRGFGQQYGHLEPSVRQVEQKALVLPKLRIDLVVPDEIADAVVGAIAKSVSTGSIGDGKIWTSTVDSVVRVRTGERGPDAA